MKTHHLVAAASAEAPSTRQRLFARYFMAILTDLVVLNLLAEYWSRVTVESFSVSLLTAILLQLLLQATFAVEHRIAIWFESRSGVAWKVVRLLSGWLVLFGSKLVMLGAIDRIFGDAVHFSGPMHGVGPFIGVVGAMLAAEELMTRAHRAMA
jgi:hypothetical protein